MSKNLLPQDSYLNIFRITIRTLSIDKLYFGIKQCKKDIEYCKEYMNSDKIKENMLISGCWPFLKQRPYDIIANPNDVPKSIFVSTLNTAPISADIEIILNEQKEEFKTGISLLKKWEIFLLFPLNLNRTMNWVRS